MTISGCEYMNIFGIVNNFPVSSILYEEAERAKIIRLSAGKKYIS